MGKRREHGDLGDMSQSDHRVTDPPIFRNTHIGFSMRDQDADVLRSSFIWLLSVSFFAEVPLNWLGAQDHSLIGGAG